MRVRWFGPAIFSAVVLASSESLAQNAITQWTAIASDTIVAKGGKPSATSAVWFAYASIAVYDAVNAIERRFQPFYYHGAAPRGASEEAAAVAAAHKVLVAYFPAQQAALDAQFADALAKIAARPRARDAGVATGEAAAASLIAARSGDGLEANVPYSPGTGPGVWQPTPPKFAAALTPWLGLMRPFTMRSASQFLPHGPTPLSTD